MNKFPLGQIVITANAESQVSVAERHMGLTRHSKGDWGDLCEEDKRLNDDSIKGGGRLMSSFKVSKDLTFWIITEADRSTTTILLPEDY